jgi:hypothetical protein
LRDSIEYSPKNLSPLERQLRGVDNILFDCRCYESRGCKALLSLQKVGAKLVGAGDVVTAAVEGNTNNMISSLAAGRVCLSAVRPKK